MAAEKKILSVLWIAATVIAALLILLTGGVWPALLLALIYLCASAIGKLTGTRKKPIGKDEQPSAPQPRRVEPLTEEQLVRDAFGLHQRRITENVARHFPNAKWTWSTSDAYIRFANGRPLAIMLNGAGGYRTFNVVVRDLRLVCFTCAGEQRTSGGNTAEENTPNNADDESEVVDYGLLAFEWVDANLPRLNAVTETSFHIPAEELPHGDSWPAICNELLRNGFAVALPMANGIGVVKEADKA